MSEIIKDKYFLMCISISLIIMLSLFVVSNEKEQIKIENENIYGIVYDINKSSNGYTFQFQKTDCLIIKCYYKYEPDVGSYEIDGKFSDDGSIFFVSSMKFVTLE
ncbi:MAG: hypothetical protein KRP56_00320 [Candidatus Methanogranum gryphiswaldense]|nr:MAG: hypothetical protein KRP56_00320 [Candidatus Methanogranum sp. U3.2.1]